MVHYPNKRLVPGVYVPNNNPVNFLPFGSSATPVRRTVDSSITAQGNRMIIVFACAGVDKTCMIVYHLNTNTLIDIQVFEWQFDLTQTFTQVAFGMADVGIVSATVASGQFALGGTFSLAQAPMGLTLFINEISSDNPDYTLPTISDLFATSGNRLDVATTSVKDKLCGSFVFPEATPAVHSYTISAPTGFAQTRQLPITVDSSANSKSVRVPLAEIAPVFVSGTTTNSAIGPNLPMPLLENPIISVTVTSITNTIAGTVTAGTNLAAVQLTCSTLNIAGQVVTNNAIRDIGYVVADTNSVRNFFFSTSFYLTQLFPGVSLPAMPFLRFQLSCKAVATITGATGAFNVGGFVDCNYHSVPGNTEAQVVCLADALTPNTQILVSQSQGGLAVNRPGKYVSVTAPFLYDNKVRNKLRAFCVCPGAWGLPKYYRPSDAGKLQKLLNMVINDCCDTTEDEKTIIAHAQEHPEASDFTRWIKKMADKLGKPLLKDFVEPIVKPVYHELQNTASGLGNSLAAGIRAMPIAMDVAYKRKQFEQVYKEADNDFVLQRNEVTFFPVVLVDNDQTTGSQMACVVSNQKIPPDFKVLKRGNHADDDLSNCTLFMVKALSNDRVWCTNPDGLFTGESYQLALRIHLAGLSNPYVAFIGGVTKRGLILGLTHEAAKLKKLVCDIANIRSMGNNDMFGYEVATYNEAVNKISNINAASLASYCSINKPIDSNIVYHCMCNSEINYLHARTRIAILQTSARMYGFRSMYFKELTDALSCLSSFKEDEKPDDEVLIMEIGRATELVHAMLKKIKIYPNEDLDDFRSTMLSIYQPYLEIHAELFEHLNYLGDKKYNEQFSKQGLPVCMSTPPRNVKTKVDQRQDARLKNTNNRLNTIEKEAKEIKQMISSLAEEKKKKDQALERRNRRAENRRAKREQQGTVVPLTDRLRTKERLALSPADVSRLVAPLRKILLSNPKLLIQSTVRCLKPLVPLRDTDEFVNKYLAAMLAGDLVLMSYVEVVGLDPSNDFTTVDQWFLQAATLMYDRARPAELTTTTPSNVDLGN